MKNKTGGYTVFISILSLLILSVGGYYGVQAWQSRTSVDDSMTKNHAYYSIRKNATPLQKEKYNSLMTELDKPERDDQAISALIAENFVADFYTWTNKLRFNDVGGMQFINKELTWVYSQALDTFYNDMRYYKEHDQLADTLEVETMSATAEKGMLRVLYEEQETVELQDGTKNVLAVDKESDRSGYRVDVTWTYRDSKVINTHDYQQKASIFVVKDDDGLYSIMEVNDGTITHES